MSYFTSIGNFGSFNPSTPQGSQGGPQAPHSQVQNPVTSRQVLPPSTQMIGVSGTGPVRPLHQPHIPRNMVTDAIPQNSRNDRKLADYGGSAMGLSMGNSGTGYGTYMPFQESSFSRKEAHQKPALGQMGGVSDSYARQFDQAQHVNPGMDIRKAYNSAPSVPMTSTHDNYMSTLLAPFGSTELQRKSSGTRDGDLSGRMTTPCIQSDRSGDLSGRMTTSCFQPDRSRDGDLSGRMFEHNSNYMYNAERNLGLGIPMNSNMGYDRNGEIGQRRRCAGPASTTVQRGIQGDPGNQYFFQNFETLNKIAENEEQINRFMDRNPVNTRRDEVEKERLADRKQFMSSQGGMMAKTTHVGAISEITPQQTRRNK